MKSFLPFCLSAFLIFCFRDKTRHVYAILLFALCFPAFAQIDPPIRAEFESAKDQQDYFFVPIANQGVVVFYQSAVLSLDTVQWIFLHYDNNLVRKNIYKIKLPNLCQYQTSDFSNNKLYFFFVKQPFRNDTLKNYLLEWDLQTEIFQLFDLQNIKYQYVSYLKVRDDHLFAIVSDQKIKTIVFYNYKTDAKQSLQLVEDEIFSIESFVIDTTTQETSFCLFLKNKKGSRAELFITDYSGKINYQSSFPVYPEIVYNSAKIAIVGRDSLLITGGYSNIKEKKAQGSYSGIYTMLFTINRFSEINTYPFGALLSRDIKTSNKLLLEPNTAMHGHIKQANGRIFAITELYYTEYQYTTSSISNRGYGYYGYNVPPMRMFSGYRYLNTFILELNSQGVLNSEWFLPLRNVLTQSVYNLVGLHQDCEENTLFFYINNNDVVSQFMNGKKVLSALSATPIELSSKMDALEYSSNISMLHWYDNNFLVSGYQYIKNNQRGKGKRYVFFLNKLICE
ncbi:MAG: hypothetical protein LBI45_03065 [Bacteroidales bacterium]|jgi:hypothetical protein|nr:hypothetical protein [Bacteroidales bacterium]